MWVLLIQRLDTFWGSSAQMKICIHGHHSRDRFPILGCRSESPTANGIDREIVHVASKALRDAKVCRPASGGDNQRQHHRSVYLPLPRLEGWGMGFNDFWWSDSIATAEDLFLSSGAFFASPFGVVPAVCANTLQKHRSPMAHAPVAARISLSILDVENFICSPLPAPAHLSRERSCLLPRRSAVPVSSVHRTDRGTMTAGHRRVLDPAGDALRPSVHQRPPPPPRAIVE